MDTSFNSTYLTEEKIGAEEKASMYYRALLVVLVLLFFSTCHGRNQNQQLIGSSCGDIHSITFPFQLQSDTQICGGVNNNFTLSCDNNRTILSLSSAKYYVHSINYNNSTIRFIDIGIQTNNNNNTNVCSSFPNNSLTPSNLTSGDPYTSTGISLLVFLNCENPVKSPYYINTTSYCNNGIDSSSLKGFSYVVAGQVSVWYVADSCTVQTIAVSSSPLLIGTEIASNFSLSDVNKALEYGFEVSWEFKTCKRCKKRASCFGDAVNVVAACSSVCSFQPSFLSKLWSFISTSFLPWLIVLGAIFILATRILCGPCVFGFLIYKFRRRHLSMFDSIEGFLRSQNNLLPIRYSYSDIKKMTEGFRDKLGEGGYGSVYKGKLRSGTIVAVKMLSKPKADGQEFINEVATIGRIHHVNVVQLIGFCAERSKRALVYDFMPNGSLEKYIFYGKEKSSLSCKQMYEISLGVARGIDYLHRGCDMQILHFDIKPHNILLDENFTPKVSDFGLAKLYPTDDSIVPLSTARGTMGYMAPELFYKNIGGVSYKADIYSFGMLLMEIAGKRRNWNASANLSQIFFPSWVYDQLSDGKHIEMEETTEEERGMVKKMMVVALWCIQMKPSNRPAMNKVVEILQGSIEFLQMPPKPFIYSQAMPTENHGNDIDPTQLPILSGACMDSLTIDVSAR